MATTGGRVLPEVDVLWYATQPLTPTYRAIIHVFADAERDTFTLELSEPEVLQALRTGPHAAEVADEAGLRAHLDELHQRGNLRPRQDERASSLEELSRRRLLWSLTTAGKIAHRAIEEIESTGISGSLQISALIAVRDNLRRLTVEELDANGAYATLNTLFEAQERFVEEARRYISRITDRDMLEVAGASEEEFRLRKEAVKLYLSRFISQLTPLVPEIDDLVRGLDGSPVAGVIQAGGSADDIPPADHTGDPAAEWRQRQHAHWDGLLR